MSNITPRNGVLRFSFKSIKPKNTTHWANVTFDS